jgi:hypothetical protein
MAKKKAMSQDKFDEFINDATHKVGEMWTEAGGRELCSDELYAINDTLTNYFCDKRD